MNRAIIPAIDTAGTSLDVAIFHLTSQELTDAILAAKGRGANVHVSMDSSGAGNIYSTHGQLCGAGIPVKFEYWNGKMHMTALMGLSAASPRTGARGATAPALPTGASGEIAEKNQVFNGGFDRVAAGEFAVKHDSGPISCRSSECRPLSTHCHHSREGGNPEASRQLPTRSGKKEIGGS
jgi:hypothetical protein